MFWLGQAGFAIRGATTTVVVDAFLSPRPDRGAEAPLSPAELDFADGVLATHEHRDHLDLPSLPAIAQASPSAQFVVPLPLIERTQAAVGRATVVGAVPGTAIAIGDASIMPVRACHGVHVADAYSFGLVPGEDRYLGYVISIDGLSIYHAGDTIRFAGMAERLRELAVDVALLPVNGRDSAREAKDLVGNLTADEAAALVRDAAIGVAVPMHYELFAHNWGSAGLFVERVAAHAPQTTVLVPGRYGGVLVPAMDRGS